MTRAALLGVGGAGALSLLVLAGCEDTSMRDRPRQKPVELTTSVPGPDGPRDARVETRRGAILILGADGKVEAVPLASARGHRALAGSAAVIAKAAATSTAAPAGTVSAKPTPARAVPATDAGAGANAATPDGTTAQERLVAEFEAQRGPVLPDQPECAGRADPKMFLGARVTLLQGQGKRGPTMVEVTATLKQGVDADTAFAYATCALAGWAARSGTPFARHIRTLQDSADGRLRVASVFTLSRAEPMGLRVVEANATLNECKTRGIPAT